MNIPFSYVKGPFYIYVKSRWSGNKIVPIYIGRGRGRRAKTYYKLCRRNGIDRYFAPNSHNHELNEEIATVRAAGQEVMIVGHDHGFDLAAAKADERRRITDCGRRDLGTGTLFNKNSGG